MVEKMKRNVRDNERSVKRSSVLRTAVLASSIMLAACGSKEKSESSGNGGSGGVAGEAGATAQTSGGNVSAGGSVSTGGQAGSSAATGGTTSCAVDARYNIDCDSTSSVSETMEVGDEIPVGVRDGVVNLRLTAVVGNDFQTSRWSATDENCETSETEIDEETSKVVSVGGKRVQVSVHEIAPNSRGTQVTATFSAVCGDVVEGAAGSGGASSCEATQEEGQATTLDVGNSVTVGNVTVELVSTSTAAAEVSVSGPGCGSGQATVNNGSTATYDLGTHEAEIQNIWSNPVQARLRVSVDSK